MLDFGGFFRAHFIFLDEEDDLDDCEEGISSDEDEMNENDNTYMERIAELAQKKGLEQGLEIVATVKVRKIKENLKKFLIF